MNEKQAVDLRALLRTVDKIKPTLRENTALGERICRLPDTSMNAMREAGLYRMWVPKTLGGLELDPMTVFEVLEAIARIDAAASWNLFMGVTPTLMGAWLSEDAASTIYSDGLVMAGALFPPLPAAPVQGGYLLSGRAPFVSGCHAATWYVFASMVVEDGQPKTDGMGNPIALAAFVPRSEVEIVENWDTLGMRGTGSHDVVLKDAFIPEQLAPLFVPYGDHPPGPAFQGPLYRLAIWSATPAAVAVSLGIARAAIEDVVRLAHQKTPAYTVTPLRERPVTQSQIAQAEGHRAAARAYVLQSLTEAYSSCENLEPFTTEHRRNIQLASTHALQAAARGVQLVHAVAGTSAIRNTERFAGYFRNIHTLTQHAFISASRYEDVGQLMVGLSPSWPFFAF